MRMERLAVLLSPLAFAIEKAAEFRDKELSSNLVLFNASSSESEVADENDSVFWSFRRTGFDAGFRLPLWFSVCEGVNFSVYPEVPDSPTVCEVNLLPPRCGRIQLSLLTG